MSRLNGLRRREWIELTVTQLGFGRHDPFIHYFAFGHSSCTFVIFSLSQTEFYTIFKDNLFPNNLNYQNRPLVDNKYC
jgi:hypothetical protein